MLLVEARGPIRPSLVRWDLEVATAFAARQPGRWWYVVDPTDAVPHPANIRYLHAVRRLPGVAGHFVVARRQPMFAVSSVLARLGGPHAVFHSLEAALAAVDRAG